MRFKAWGAALVLFMVSTAFGQFAKVGFSSATFLKIPLSARGAGMGEAFVAVANDASSVFWNPAGTAQMPGRGIYISDTEWWADSRLAALSYIQDLGLYGKIGVFIGGVISTGFQEAIATLDTVGLTGKSFDYTALQAGIHYARRLTDQFSIGLNLKLVGEYYGSYTSATSAALDVGTYFESSWKNLKLAMAMQHFGPDIAAKGQYPLITYQAGTFDTTMRDFKAFPLPVFFRVGLSLEPFDLGEDQRLVVGFELDHPNDNLETYALGVEYAFSDFLFLRTGYKYIGRTEDGVPYAACVGFSAGVGLVVPFGTHKLRLDYAFTDGERLPDVHRIGLNFSL